MAKKKRPAKPEQPTPPPLDQLHRPAKASTATDVPRSTIISAGKAGHIPLYRTACGQMLVTLADVVAYRNNPPPSGYHGHKANQPKAKPKLKAKAKRKTKP